MPTRPALTPWDHHAAEAEAAPVFPDGCRDVLVLRRAGEPVRVLLTELDMRPRAASLRAGTSIAGYRLRPGATVGPAVLGAIAADPRDARNILETEIGEGDGPAEAIEALALPGATIRSATRLLGVSERSLQRRFRDLGLPPPDYWRLLARARRAIARLSTDAPLADLAPDCGFSDQAHMTREFVRWFGAPPARLRRNPRLVDLLLQPALGNWTGEQISTR